MLVGGQYEEDTKEIKDPSYRVQHMDIIVICRRVLGDKEVQKRQGNRVTAKHVVAAGSHALNRHAAALPYHEGLRQALYPVLVWPRCTLEMSAGDR